MKKLTILSLCILFLCSCGSDTSDRDGYLRLRLKDDPSTLDPAYIVDVPGGALAAKIFNGLVRFDQDGKVIPDLASDWDISDDGLIYRFQLRKGVKFTNGREVTAEDVVYSLRRILDPKVNSPRSWLLAGVRGADSFMSGSLKNRVGINGDGNKVEIELKEPSGFFLNFLAMPNASILPREEIEREVPAFSDHPIGTGPYKIEEWEHNNRIVLSRNKDYFMGEPKVSGIEYRIIPETLTAAVEFEQGNLDIIEVPRAEYKKYSSELPWKNQILSRVGLNSYYLGFNCQKYPYDNKLLRQAFNYAIDRDKIIDVLLEGRAIPASGPVPPELLTGTSRGYEYNPEKARKLIARSGVKLPLKTTFLFKADREILSIAEVIQDYLKQVGIELILVQREWSSFKEAANKGEFDILYLSWWGDYPDAENFLFPTFFSGNIGPGGNRSRFSDREVDRLLTDASRETDQEARIKLLSNVERKIVELAPWVFLWHKKEVMIRQERVKNYRIPLIYNGDKFNKIELVF